MKMRSIIVTAANIPLVAPMVGSVGLYSGTSKTIIEVTTDEGIVQNTDDASIVKAFGGIEIALWDIRGKVWNQSLYQLLGNLVRNRRNLDEI